LSNSSEGWADRGAVEEPEFNSRPSMKEDVPGL